jgi:16S rRNA (adenine1518-N6/adenine1519-N6)-dimethyltransferase
MSLQEVKFLLRENDIVPNRLLGQNFMIDSTIFPKMSSYADINAGDVVLDAGAGFGFLTHFLASKCRSVIAVEKDHQLAAILRRRLLSLSNVSVLEGDMLKLTFPAFNKVISIPPYYLSSELIVWLTERPIDCSILIVQNDFAKRLLASVGEEEYGWLTVAMYKSGKAEMLDEIPKWMFYPQPKVDSIILRLKPWKAPPFVVKDQVFFRQMLKWLFSKRNKKLGTALTPFIRNTFNVDKSTAAKMASALTHKDKRVRELNPPDFGAIANELHS